MQPAQSPFTNTHSPHTPVQETPTQSPIAITLAQIIASSNATNRSILEQSKVILEQFRQANDQNTWNSRDKNYPKLFDSVFINRDKYNVYTHVAEQCYKQSLIDDGLRSSKKLKEISSFGIEDWNKQLYPSVYEYLTRVYDAKLSELCYLSIFEKMTFTALAFPKIRDTIIQTVVELAEPLLRQKIDHGVEPTQKQLRLKFSLPLAKSILQGTQILTFEPWKDHLGQSLGAHYEILLENNQVRRGSQDKNATHAEHRDTLKILKRQLEKKQQTAILLGMAREKLIAKLIYELPITEENHENLESGRITNILNNLQIMSPAIEEEMEITNQSNTITKELKIKAEIQSAKIEELRCAKTQLKNTITKLQEQIQQQTVNRDAVMTCATQTDLTDRRTSPAQPFKPKTKSAKPCQTKSSLNNTSTNPANTCNPNNTIKNAKQSQKIDKTLVDGMELIKDAIGGFTENQKLALAVLVSQVDGKTWDCSTNSLSKVRSQIAENSTPISFEKESKTKTVVYACNKSIIPAHGSADIKIKLRAENETEFTGRSWVISPLRNSKLGIPERVVLADSVHGTTLFVCNFTPNDIYIRQNQEVAVASLLDLVDLPANDLKFQAKDYDFLTDAETAEILVLAEAYLGENLTVMEKEETFCNFSGHDILTKADEAKADDIKNQIDKFNAEQDKKFTEKFLNDKIPKSWQDVFKRYKNSVFASDTPGNWNLLKVAPVKLPIKGNCPDKVPLSYRKRFPPDQLKVIEDWIQTSLARGLIKKSNSKYLSNLVLTPKPNGKSWRVCTDFRKVNDKCFDDCTYQIPMIEDIKLKMGNCAVFSTFDHDKAFWRARLHEESQKYTAFAVSQGICQGIYQYQVLPMGPKASPAVFSQLMADCYKGLGIRGLELYVDDDIVGSATIGDSKEEIIEKHAIDLEAFLGRSEKIGAKLSIDKAKIGQKEIEFIGLRIGNGVVKPGEKVRKKLYKVIGTLDITKKAKDSIDKLIGFYNYSRKFLEHFSKNQRKIRRLKSEYDSEAKQSTDKEALDELGHNNEVIIRGILIDWSNRLASTKGLAIPKRSQTIEIASDSSGQRIGYIARVKETGQIIEFDSRELTSTEKNYKMQELELLAAAEAIQKTKLMTARAAGTLLHIDNKNGVSHLTKAKSPWMDGYLSAVCGLFLW